MLSPIQKRKLARFFFVCDTDKNGTLEKADYERIVNNLAALQNWKPGDSGYDRLYANFVGNIWEHLAQFGDTDNDNRVTLDEWFAYCDEMLSSEESYKNEVYSRALLVFEALDTNRDGRYTVEDFVQFYHAYGIDTELAAPAFKRLDRDGSGELSMEEVAPICFDFHYSEDPSNPCNYFYGTF